MITLLLLLWFIISLITIVYLWKTDLTLPKPVIIAFCIGTIITFLLIGINFIDNRLLDINHPVYTTPNSGLSTVSILISIAGGVITAGPFALIKIIKYKRMWK